MTTEVLNGTPAPVANENGTSAAAQPNAATTEALTGGAEGGESSQVTPKTYTEEEHRDAIERATAKAAAKAERRAFREAASRLESRQSQQPQQPASQPTNDGKPARAQFANDEAYVDALVDWKQEQRDRQTQAQRQQEQVQEQTKKTTKLYAQAEAIGDDFDRDVFDEHLTAPIAQALVDSENAARLMHYLGANPEEMQRIAQLPQGRQGPALGRIEAKLEAEPAKPPKTSKAPAPIGDPTARGTTTTTFSGDLSKLPMDQYIAQRKKQGARWAR